jgi:glycosyltransferase involved in cell wall biosynthesis
MNLTSPQLCIVVPVFNEQEVLPELIARLTSVMDGHAQARWSVIFVNDGSKDGSAEIVKDAATKDPRFRLVQFSRNFGHQPALTAGLNHAGYADAVITMDADLQDPPEVIPALIAAWKNGAEVVLAVRRSREDRGLRRFGFDAFHRMFGLVADFPVRANTGTFGLLAKPAVAAFNQLGEANRFFPGLRAWVGFTCAEVIYDRKERAAGQPGQNFSRLVRYALDGVFSFSYLPLRLLTYAGLLTASGGFATGLFFAVRRLLGQEIAFTGFTTLVVLVLFMGGIQLIGIGVLGEYLGRIYDEVKRRPSYVVKSKVGFE